MSILKRPRKPLSALLALCLCAACFPCPAFAAPADDFFSDAVFFGDSLTVGLADYAQKQRDAGTPCLGEAQFLAEIGYTLSDPYQPDGFEKHPLYRNRRQAPFKSLQRMEPGKVFVLLGTNDATDEVAALLDRYAALLSTLRETLPDARLIVQALPPIIAERQTESFSNAKLKEINAGLMALAHTHGADFLDLSGVVAKDGALDPALCSDAYLHLNEAAYALYAAQLSRFAAFCEAAAGPMQVTTVKRQVIISGRDLPSRKGRVLAHIPGGTALNAPSRSGAWYEVEYQAQSMYVHESALLISGSLPLTLTGNAVLHTAPDENSESAGEAAAGETLRILSGYYSPEWLLCADDGRYAYVRHALVQTQY
ncbi:MAG: SGNH/GDSL hydrolase family protein [Clostridia bacterium]|nr:SGNH/GDSL hydrolase family protein [Clostridia bacterium]